MEKSIKINVFKNKDCNKKIVVVSYDMKGGKKVIRPVIIISVTV